jgi:hypothetical protein
MADSFIERTRDSIREIAGEPTVHAKYSDDRLLTWIEQAYAHLLGEIGRRASNPLVVRFDIPLSTDTRVYTLPPIVQRVLDLEMLDESGNTVWYERPRSRYNPAGPNLVFEASTIRFTKDLTNGYTLRVHFIPSGCVALHTGAVASVDDVPRITNDPATNTATVVLAETPTAGTVDRRPNAYAGSIFRVLSDTGDANYIQDRIITAYNVATRTATLSPAFVDGFVPTGDEVLYEIAPPIERAMDIVIATYVARTLCGIEGDAARFRTLSQLYAEQVRDIVAQVNHFSALDEGLKRDTRFTRGKFVPNSMWNLGASSPTGPRVI